MKRLIILCDGTWNTPDQKDRRVACPTNVVKLARWMMPRAPASAYSWQVIDVSEKSPAEYR